MKIAQYLPFKKKKNTSSFQKELWDEIWTETSFEKLVNQLIANPIYWRLKKLINKSDSILEAGCGFGQWVYRLNSLGYKVAGVDTAKKTIKRINKLKPNLDISFGDVENLPFKNNSFSVYLSFGVVEHFESGPEKVLSEAHRVLKKDGLLFLTIPYLNFLRFIKLKVAKNEDSTFYQYLYSKGEIVKIIKKAGFKITRVAHYDFLSAVKRDLPLAWKLLNKTVYKRMEAVSEKKMAQHRKSIRESEKEPNFFIQELLYKIDSYILLIEARKVKK